MIQAFDDTQRTSQALADATGAGNPSKYIPLVRGRTHSISPPNPAGVGSPIVGLDRFGRPVYATTQAAPNSGTGYNPATMGPQVAPPLPPSSAVVTNTNLFGLTDAELSQVGMIGVILLAAWFLLR